MEKNISIQSSKYVYKEKFLTSHVGQFNNEKIYKCGFFSNFCWHKMLKWLVQNSGTKWFPYGTFSLFSEPITKTIKNSVPEWNYYIIITGKEDGGKSRFVYRTVRLEFYSKCVRLRSDHWRRFLATVHAVLPQFVRSDFTVHFDPIVFAFGLVKRKTW